MAKNKIHKTNLGMKDASLLSNVWASQILKYKSFFEKDPDTKGEIN